MRPREHTDAQQERISREAIELKVAIQKAMNDHGDRHGMLDPQVVMSALGSSMIDLFVLMREVGYPPHMLASFKVAADLYLEHLPGQIAAAIAGRPLPATGITVETRGTAQPATHKGGRA